MASLRKCSGDWRAEIAVLGTRESEIFSTKAEAIAWAAEREAQLRRSDATGIVAGKTCLQAFERYRDEVSVHKKGRIGNPSDYPQSLSTSSPTRDWALPGRGNYSGHPGAMA